MQKVLTLIGLAAYLTVTASASVVWVVDSTSELYTVNTATVVATRFAPLLNSINTIAVGNGILYGMGSLNHNLYAINGLGKETLVAATGKAGIVGLAGDNAGNIWLASVNNLFEYSAAGALLNSYTGTFAPGDLEFIGPKLYMTQNNVLYTVTTAGGVATAAKVNNVNTLAGNTVGLAVVPGSLMYGFSATQVYTVNSGTGTSTAGVKVTGLSGTIVDAAGTPEPATFGIIGLGLIGLGGLAYRRRKA